LLTIWSVPALTEIATFTRAGARPAETPKSGPEAEERVVELVNQALHGHRLHPGDRLVERELSLAAGASRLAVRNALLRLAQAGLVDLSRNKGARVVECSPDLAHQIMAARIVVEEAALRILAGRLDEAGRGRLEAILRAEASAYDDGRLAEGSHRAREFHVAFAELAGNVMIARFVRELIDCQPLLSGRAGRVPTFSGVPAHTKTLAALIRGDGDEAAAINTRLLADLERTLLGGSGMQA
jgi:DNA-binding GntR family transcriptional regulator